MITFTLDLEDHLDVYAGDGRWAKNTDVLLDFCAARKIRGTFFTVGKVAGAAPQLLKKITDAGHELALHSYDHIPLTKEDSKSYAGKLDASKKKFEDISGQKIEGFRAPVFSLTPQSKWAIDVLSQQGFVYSSSVIAGKSAFAGYPGAPATPFKWLNGLIELPVPAMRLGQASVPFLGGVYLRYLPLPLVKSLQAANKALHWTYLHPYDIDADEGFVKLEDGTPLWANILLMNNRKNFLKKLGSLLENQNAPPLIERTRDLKNLPVFSGNT
jgi:polysaccharide deacetylase family protein (PEP-CTERM system associated)